MENYVNCKSCKHFDGKMKCTLFCEEVYPDYTRKCSEFDASKAAAIVKCGDCIHYANRDCPVGDGNTTADYECECPLFALSANGSKMVSDNVNHPAHYTAGGIECVDAMKACVSGLNEMEAVCTSHALKYLWRWKHKNGAEDIRKCIWWLERLLKEIDNE